MDGPTQSVSSLQPPGCCETQNKAEDCKHVVFVVHYFNILYSHTLDYSFLSRVQ